jgi:hypothetical protein
MVQNYELFTTSICKCEWSAAQGWTGAWFLQFLMPYRHQGVWGYSSSTIFDAPYSQMAIRAGSTFRLASRFIFLFL